MIAPIITDQEGTTLIGVAPRWHADPAFCVCDDETHDLVRRDHRDYLKCRACGTETPAPVGARIVDEEAFDEAWAAGELEPTLGHVLAGILIAAAAFVGAAYGIAAVFGL